MHANPFPILEVAEVAKVTEVAENAEDAVKKFPFSEIAEVAEVPRTEISLSRATPPRRHPAALKACRRGVFTSRPVSAECRIPQFGSPTTA